MIPVVWKPGAHRYSVSELRIGRYSNICVTSDASTAPVSVPSSPDMTQLSEPRIELLPCEGVHRPMSSPARPAALAGLDVEQPGFFLRDDYFDILAWLRTNDPVHRSSNGMVLVSRYEDIREISRSPLRYSSRRGALVNDPVRFSGPNDRAGSLLHLDPPIHAEYRKLLNRQFTPRAVAKMCGAVRSVTTGVFEAIDRKLEAGATDLDFVEQIAMPVPVLVIAELLGIRDQSLDDLRRWSDAAMAVSDDQSPGVLADISEFAAFLSHHVRTTFERADAGERGDDLISLLATSRVGGHALSRS